MTEPDTDADDQLDLAAEVQRAQNNTVRENLKESLAGWRDTAGMHMNAAIAIDAVFLLAGASAILEASGLLQGAGYVITGIGALGLLEKVWRRL